jgi:uncharacterized lipoprotein YajG
LSYTTKYIGKPLKSQQKNPENMKKITLFLLCSLFVLTNCQKVKENCEYTPDFDNLSESLSESLDGIAQIEVLQHKTRCQF